VDDPLTVEELRGLAEQVGGVEVLVSRRSPQYRARAQALAEAEPEAWLAALAEEPRMVRRPIWRASPDKPWRVGFDPKVWEADLGS
jgi:arsenate reductase-like glutaredoxin family protein